MIVKRIGAMSLARITGLIYAGLGLVIGALFAMFAVLGGALGTVFGWSDGGPFVGIFLGAGAIVTLPILYGFFGFVGGLLIAFLYNLVAGSIGGLQLDVE